MTILNRDDLRAIVMPTPTQVLSYIFLALLILTGVNADRLLQPVAKYVPTADIRIGLAAILHYIGQLAAANTFVLILFWSLIGLTVYGVCWAIFNALVHTYNEAVIDTQFANRGSWLEQLSPAILQVFFGLAAIGFTLASGWIIAALVQNFALSLIDWTPQHLITEIGQTFLLALDFYVWWALVKLTFYVE
jgi:hypothetical protein